MNSRTRRALVGAVVIGCAVGGVIGLLERSRRGMTGMAVGEEAGARVYAVGSQRGGDGWITLYQEGRDEPIAAVQVPWQDYNEEVGSAEVVAARLGNRRAQKFVVGLGAMPGGHGGWVVILDDVARGCAPVKWLHVGSPDDPPLATHVAAGDLDGDGREEIVVGVGPCEGRPGRAYVFSDLRGRFAPLATLTVPWSSYTAGETRPAVGDLDGDGKAEVVLGLGAADAGGWLAVYQDLKFYRWVRSPDAAYDAIGEGTWPACGDVNGEGRAQLLIGTDAGGGGRVAIVADTLGTPKVTWCRVPWKEYDSSPGETHPRCVHAHAGSRAQMLLELSDFTAPTRTAALLDDGAVAYRFLGWRKGWRPALPEQAAEESPAPPPDPAREARDAALEELRGRAEGGVNEFRDDTGMVTSLSGSLHARVSDQPQGEARAFLDQNKGIWGLTNVDRDLAAPTATTNAGETCLSYQQVISGVPLLYHHIDVHVGEDGSVGFATANIEPGAVGLQIDPTPRLAAEDAIAEAARQANAPLLETPQPVLGSWYDSTGAHLVWQVPVISLVGPIAKDYLIDATTGQAIYTADQISMDTETPEQESGVTTLGHAVSDVNGLFVRHLDRAGGSVIFSHQLIDRTGKPQITIEDGTPALSSTLFSGGDIEKGTLRAMAVITSDSKTFSDKQAVTAQRNLRKVLDYWQTRFPSQLKSINPPDIQAAVHLRFTGFDPQGHAIANSPNNAVAFGGRGVIGIGDGDGLLFSFVGALDVLAHEFGHFVVARTVNLSARRTRGGAPEFPEAFGLNEHIADAFGVWVEFQGRSEVQELGASDVLGNPVVPADPDGQVWSIGEEVMVAGIRTPIEEGRAFITDLRGITEEHEIAKFVDNWLWLWVHGTTGLKDGVYKFSPDKLKLDGLRARQVFADDKKMYHFLEQCYADLLFGKGLGEKATLKEFRAAMEKVIRNAPAVDSGVKTAALEEARKAFEAVGMPAMELHGVFSHPERAVSDAEAADIIANPEKHKSITTGIRKIGVIPSIPVTTDSGPIRTSPDSPLTLQVVVTNNTADVLRQTRVTLQEVDEFGEASALGSDLLITEVPVNNDIKLGTTVLKEFKIAPKPPLHRKEANFALDVTSQDLPSAKGPGRRELLRTKRIVFKVRLITNGIVVRGGGAWDPPPTQDSNTTVVGQLEFTNFTGGAVPGGTVEGTILETDIANAVGGPVALLPIADGGNSFQGFRLQQKVLKNSRGKRYHVKITIHVPGKGDIVLGTAESPIIQ